MLQDIAPHRFKNEYCPRSCKPQDRVLVFSEDRLLCAMEGGVIELPTAAQLGISAGQYAFTLDDAAFFLWEGAPLEERSPWRYIPCKSLRDVGPAHLRFAAAVGKSLARWYHTNRYCGVCGAAMAKSETERALVCPKCGQTVYPKIAPAVIVAVTDGDRLLLTKYAGRAFTRYALVAGFAEIGETIEQTVHREVAEETGLAVKNLRFYRSQPWVYTDSLLFGFWAELDGSDEIRRQESELSEAAWFARDALPSDHSEISLTGEMIELFRAGGERSVP